MNNKVLIVEDQFVEANDLQLMLTRAGYKVTGIARSVIAAQEIIDRDMPDLVLLDIQLKGKLTGIDLAKNLKSAGIAFIYLSANSNEEILTEAKMTQPYGFLVKPFREKDLLVTLEIAKYRHEHSIESQFRKEALLQKEIEKIITEQDSWKQKLLHIGRILQPYFSFDFFGAGFSTIEEHASSAACSFLRIGYDEYQTIGPKELFMITGLNEQAIHTMLQKSVFNNIPIIYNGEDFLQACREQPLVKLFANTFQLQSYISLPLHLSNGEVFNFCFYSLRPDIYNSEHISLFSRLQFVLTKNIEGMLQEGKNKFISPDKNIETVSSSPAIETQTKFKDIIGKSHLLLNALDLVTIVAPSDSMVLILGESGTGKERIADYIHQLSPRKSKPFIKVNCATLPPTLIESELFGHEKGSFTGALEKRIGKFEQAEEGTIFLDEIGEMPLELQVKLLRVLQEKEIERIGSKAPTKINVRIIAATNRNLEREVAQGRFRLDLYYRLNVFPIQLPSLNERIEDIPELVHHFINYFGRKIGKKLNEVPGKVLDSLMNYNWPGNIRELEHLIERSVLLAKGSTIEDIPLPGMQQKEKAGNNHETKVKTINENERDHILAVLQKSNGRIWGAGGAAELLNVPPTTLASKMKKLGIKRMFSE